MLLNYTTNVPVENTVTEIQKLLSGHNVSAMMTEYDGPEVSAVSFRILITGKQMAFKLPCNWRAVKEIMKKKNANRKRFRSGSRYRLESLVDDSDAQAQRVAWRIVKDWVEAQLAMVEVNMVTVPQVFLPHMVMRDGRTLSEHVESDPKFLLGNGE